MARPTAKPSMIGEVGTVKVAVVVIATILTGFTLYALRRMVEPFVMALFLLIMVDGVARVLSVRVPGFPKKAALPIAIASIVLAFALTIWITADNAHALAAQSPLYTARINALLSQGAQRLGLHVTPTLAELIEKLNPSRFAGVLAEAVSQFAEAAVFVLIYLGFLVASRQGFAAKTSQLFLSADDREEAQRVFMRVRRGVEQYIWVQTLVGLLITALSAALMALTGLSHIPFWCLIIFLANYIPVVGAAVGVMFPALFGLVEVDGVVRAVVLLAGLEAIHFLVSHVIQPRMQGKRLNVDPIVVLLALTFWSALWGVTGAFLSTPLTVLAMAILAEFKGTRPLAVLLSGDGRPDADMAG